MFTLNASPLRTAPGATVAVDPDALAAPAPFSKAAAGDYRVQALLDVDHSYAYNGPGTGDLSSEIVASRALDPAAAALATSTSTERRHQEAAAGPVTGSTVDA